MANKNKPTVYTDVDAKEHPGRALRAFWIGHDAARAFPHAASVHVRYQKDGSTLFSVIVRGDVGVSWDLAVRDLWDSWFGFRCEVSLLDLDSTEIGTVECQGLRLASVVKSASSLRIGACKRPVADSAHF